MSDRIPILRDAELDPEDADDSDAYRDALINGDPAVNRLVKLTDHRFASQARRTNKWRKEMRDEFAALRADLAPALEIAELMLFVVRHWRIAGSVFGTVISILITIIYLGIWP